jgi:hypothetical protein
MWAARCSPVCCGCAKPKAKTPDSPASAQTRRYSKHHHAALALFVVNPIPIVNLAASVIFNVELLFRPDDS